MKHHYYITKSLVFLIYVFGLGHFFLFGQVFSDSASNYGSTWSNNSNFGTGFGPWVLSSGNNTGRFIGNPSNDGMGTTGIGTTAFGMFATSSTNYSTAYRSFLEPLQIGDRLSFFWAINWDANTGNKGFDIRSGNTTVFNVNNAGSASIVSTSGTASPNYGTIPMEVSIIRMNATEYLLQMNRRFSGGGDFYTIFTHSGPINGIYFYIGAQSGAESQRNLYFNQLSIQKNLYSNGVPNFVLYKWSGALTPNSIKVNAKLSRVSNQSRLLVSTQSNFSNPIFSPFQSVNSSTNFMGAFQVDNLTPDTEYFYTIESDGIIDLRPEAIGRFKTAKSGANSFSFTAGACNFLFAHPVFLKIKEKNPLFMLISGDLHYRDPNSTDVNVHRIAYERNVLSMGNIRSLYNDVPIAYVWDDHDFSGNDSNASSIGAESAKQAYREYVPHYPFGTGIQNQNSSIYQSFVIGRVRFIMTDLRSEGTESYHMSPQQMQWFKNECLAAKNANQMICWVSSFGVTANNSDSWGGSLAFRQQRNEIFSFLNQSNIQNLFIISGDAHAIGIDDGDNTDCAGVTETNNCERAQCSWSARYPLFHTAALGNTFTVKGVVTNILPMSGVNEAGQYGKIDVVDNGGDEITIQFTAYRVSVNSGNETILGTYSFTRNLNAIDETITLVPQKANWKYLDNGSDQGVNWKNNVFDDSTWSNGNAPFGYAMTGVETEVSYGSNPQNKHITTYFRKSFTILQDQALEQSQLSLWLDDGAVAYLNGIEIAKANFNHTTWNYLTPATTVVTNQPMNFKFCLSTLPIVIGDNVLAVEVHQHAPNSSDLFFDAEIIGKKNIALGLNPIDATNHNQNLFTLYPNPTFDKVKIKSKQTPQSWAVYDVNGSLLLKNKWDKPEHTTIEIDLSKLPAGMYFIEVTYYNTKQSSKIIKK